MASKNTPGYSGPRQTKDERRAEAREKARVIREQQEKRAKRNKILTIVGIVVALLLVVLAVWKIVSSDKGASAAELGDYEGQARPVATSNVTDDYGVLLDVEGGATTEETGASVVGVWSDYMCIGCQNFDMSYHPLMEQYNSAGDIQMKLYAVDSLGWKYSTQGAAALYYVAEFAPEHIWTFHQALMERGFQIGKGQVSEATAAEIADIAKTVGIADDVVNDLPASIISEEWQQVVKDSLQTFRDNGYHATPTITVNGVENTEWANDPTTIIPQLFEEAVAGTAK